MVSIKLEDISYYYTSILGICERPVQVSMTRKFLGSSLPIKIVDIFLPLLTIWFCESA